MLVDSHCHLNYPDFETDLEDILVRASESGISNLLTICTKIEEFHNVLSIAKRNKNIFCSVGVHPHNVDTCEKVSKNKLLKLASHESVVGFGETGFDLYYQHSSKKSQEISFRTHIAASRETDIPVIIHTRDAEKDTIRVLENEYGDGKFFGVIHCFSSTPKLAEVALKLGFYISISGIVTFKNAGSLREIITEVPLNRLLLETDAPYLAPVPKRGQRNEPSFVTYTLQKVAEIKGVSSNYLAQVTSENFFRLFSKAMTKR